MSQYVRYSTNVSICTVQYKCLNIYGTVQMSQYIRYSTNVSTCTVHLHSYSYCYIYIVVIINIHPWA